jgi:hypothetical protein
MNFLQFLKSLDDLFYEIVTWLVFYPVTLWRTLRQPSAMMDYADSELGDSAEEQYTDTLSPPIFLLLTLLLSHALELAVVGQNPLLKSTHGLASLISDNTSLLLVRLVFFSVFPLIMSVRLLRLQKTRLTRESLRTPFYAQCYPTSIFALIVGIGALVTQLHRGDTVTAIGALTIAGAFIWFGSLQAAWFRRVLSISWFRGLFMASIAMVECLIAFAAGASLVA